MPTYVRTDRITSYNVCYTKLLRVGCQRQFAQLVDQLELDAGSLLEAGRDATQRVREAFGVDGGAEVGEDLAQAAVCIANRLPDVAVVLERPGVIVREHRIVQQRQAHGQFERVGQVGDDDAVARAQADIMRANNDRWADGDQVGPHVDVTHDQVGSRVIEDATQLPGSYNFV